MENLRGFLEHPRKNARYRPVKERLKDYREFVEALPKNELEIQASRCMDCGTPFCHAMGCPVFNLIPEWSRLIYNGKWKEALDRLEMTNSFPEITARICPAPCEASCTLSINSAPVSIKQLELTLVENAYRQGGIVPMPPRVDTGKRIAVIGSGPAGLAAAQKLRRSGHRVTLFEKDNRIGGLLRYGIPDFKLEKWVIDRRLQQMKDEGVEFQTGVLIGEDISARYLQRTYDATLLSVGAGTPRDLNVIGRGRDGIYFAMEYLKCSNMYVSGEIPKEELISAKNRTVLVIGGGDTGSDCVGTANRQSAKKIYQFEIMPRPTEWHSPWNPNWPEWPMILFTSSSHEEGCERQWGIQTIGFHGRSTSVEEVYFNRVKWETDARRKTIMKEIPETEFSLRVDMVLLCLGFTHAEHSRLIRDLDLKLDSGGNIQVDKDYATSVPGVFAAGDATTGSSLVVRAIFHGQQAASCINRYLGNRSSIYRRID